MPAIKQITIAAGALGTNAAAIDNRPCTAPSSRFTPLAHSRATG